MYAGKSHTDMFVALACLIGALSFYSCTSLDCARRNGEAKVLLRLNHTSGGIGPVFYEMTIYQDRNIGLKKAGKRGLRSRLAVEDFDLILSTLHLEEIQKLETSQYAGIGWEEAWVEIENKKFGVVLEKTPAVLAPLFRILDILYAKHFGHTYDMPLNPKVSSDESTRSRVRTKPGPSEPRIG